MIILVKDTQNKYIEQAYTTTNGVKTTTRYTHIQTDKIYQVIEGLGYNPVSSQTGKKQTVHSRHITRFEHPNIICEGLKPQLIVDNAHDGTRSLFIRFGCFRVYCANGLVIGSDIIKPLRIRHVGQPVDIEKRIYEFVAQATAKVVEMYTKFSQIELTTAEILDLARDAHILRYGKDTACADTQLASAYTRREEDNGNTLWAVYNRLQESLMYGTTKRSRKIKSERRAVDFNDDLCNLANRYCA